MPPDATTRVLPRTRPGSSVSPPQASNSNAAQLSPPPVIASTGLDMYSTLLTEE